MPKTFQTVPDTAVEDAPSFLSPEQHFAGNPYGNSAQIDLINQATTPKPDDQNPLSKLPFKVESSPFKSPHPEQPNNNPYAQPPPDPYRFRIPIIGPVGIDGGGTPTHLTGGVDVKIPFP